MQQARKPLSGKAMLTQSETGVLIALIAIMAIFGMVRSSFLTLPTWAVILRDTAELGVIAIGAALLITSGEFDLSVGSNFGLTGLVFAMMMSNGLPAGLAFALALALATAIGFTNGLLTLVTKIPSFIVTLGGLFGIRGVALLISGGRPNTFLGESAWLDWLGGIRFREFFNFSIETVWWVLLVLAAWLMLTRTRWGNWIYATGGNRDAALAGACWPVSRARCSLVA